MSSTTRRVFDVLVIGGGPAGLAAAACAAENGRRVGIVDDNPALGGQIWRGESTDTQSPAARWAERVRCAGAEVLCGTRVFHQPQAGCLLAETMMGVCEIRYQRLILATGARERFLPFPGWTLPNVMGVGGLQAFVKSGLPIAGKTVVVAGSGPLLLAVAAYLREHGAEVPVTCEQASWNALIKFFLALRHHPQKIRQAFTLRKQISGTSFAANCWPVAAEGKDAVEAVVISRGGKTQRVPCDYLACAFHLVPNTELPALLGCQIESGFVMTDEFQRTSLTDVYCVGEPTGIGGVEQSLAEGEIAGLSVAEKSDAAKELFLERNKLRKFSLAMAEAFQLREELRSLPLPGTFVCRCEDVTHSRLKQQPSWRAAKLQTRCGMGACQGRICGPATEFLFDWTTDAARPPIFPTPLENLAAVSLSAE